MSDTEPRATPAPGSLHDPTSRVYLHDDTVVRGLDASSAAELAELVDSAFFAQAVAEGVVIPTAMVDPASVGLDGWAGAMVHERVPVVTFPYEWTFSMLRDAAVAHLDIVLAAMEAGYTTKDASPFNIQFIGSQPTFIDVGSFERLRPGQPWLGYRQFCELFLNPLLVQAYTGIDARRALRGSVRGLTPQATRRTLPRRARMRWGVFTNVSLHAAAERRYAKRSGDVGGELARAGMGPAVVRAQLGRLRSLVASLRWTPGESTWSGYTERTHYDDADLAAKTAFVAGVAGMRHRSRAIDLGANDGTFCAPLRPHTDHIVALDGDEVVVDRLYGELHRSGDRQVTPLCVDLADPGGGLGWAGAQRTPVWERLSADLALCLAVAHHVVISDSVPTEAFVAALADLAGEVVLELPLPDDPKVQRLVANKAGRPAHPYGQDVFEHAAAARFDVRRSEVLPSGRRVVYHLTRR